MGSSEMDKAAKEAKTPTSQEQASATSAGTPDWSGFQAYSPMPPHGYMASSPQAHPYMWGVQHMMPPYATPPHPYVAMYPHGGIYAHPSMPPGSYPFSPFAIPSPNGVAEASGNNTPVSMEVDGKSPDGKEKLPIKRSKGSLGSLNMITGKKNEGGKTSGASANGGYSKSGESASEGSSEGSDADSRNGSQMKSGSRQDSLEGDASQNENIANGSQNGGSTNNNNMGGSQTMAVVPMSTTGGVAGPTTNLNIGMDYWGGGGGGATSSPAIRGGKLPSTQVAAGGIINPAAAAASRGGEGIQSQIWLQDERELKRQRRKQSNRESARRSRLRKQAECDELAQRAEVLKEENAALRAEVSRIRSDYEQLLAQNASLKERLGEAPGREVNGNEAKHIGQTEEQKEKEAFQSDGK